MKGPTVNNMQTNTVIMAVDGSDLRGGQEGSNRFRYNY